ncbi:hypothetical protein SAMN05518670_1941 [Paenibacillus sp. OK076]|nr:hypothetical protein SAMN05518670_1941 [Paenibacillus sp. OK076]
MSNNKSRTDLNSFEKSCLYGFFHFFIVYLILSHFNRCLFTLPKQLHLFISGKQI